MWKTKQLNDLSSQELLAILKLRIDTFVLEQERIYPEIDEIDKTCFHVFYLNSLTHEVESYARIYGQADHVSFGRVATKKSLRGTGMSTTLMEHVLTVCQNHFAHQPIEIEAQTQVVGFYEKFNFKTSGEPFTFNYTPHIKMILAAQP